MNTYKHVATFHRLTDGDESYGPDKSAKIYKITTPDGSVSFAISLFEGDVLQSCQGDYVSYGWAMRPVIKWLDNSDFYL